MAELVYLDTDEQHPYITPEAGTKQYVQPETTNQRRKSTRHENIYDGIIIAYRETKKYLLQMVSLSVDLITQT